MARIAKRRRWVIGLLVIANLITAGGLLRNARLEAQQQKTAALDACCGTCICWCHTDTNVCDSLGTGNRCGGTGKVLC